MGSVAPKSGDARSARHFGFVSQGSTAARPAHVVAGLYASPGLSASGIDTVFVLMGATAMAQVLASLSSSDRQKSMPGVLWAVNTRWNTWLEEACGIVFDESHKRRR